MFLIARACLLIGVTLVYHIGCGLSMRLEGAGTCHLPTSGSQKSLFIELQVSVQNGVGLHMHANSMCNGDITLHHYTMNIITCNYIPRNLLF